MHLSIKQAPANVQPILARLLRSGFAKAGVEYRLLPVDQQAVGVSTDNLRELLQTGLPFSSGEKGKEDWVAASIVQAVGICETSDGDIATFVLNFNLVE